MTSVIPTEASVAALNDQINKVEPQIVETLTPNPNEVSLPGGYIDREGVLHKYAEVRELTGADEEAIVQAEGSGRLATLILQRGLVSVGGVPATDEILNALLSGDRDAILLGILKATFGNLSPQMAVCPVCADSGVFEINLDTDVPTRELENPIEDRKWYMDLKVGRALVTLPKGATQKRLGENQDKTGSELNTLLIGDCIISINGELSSGSSLALKLGMADRSAVLKEILARNPGPRLGEVTAVCEKCEKGNLIIPMSLAGLFRLQQ